MDGDPVELGVALLEHLEDESLELSTAIDRLEAITTDPALQRQILDEAETRGAITRDRGVISPRRGAFVRFERTVTAKDGEFTCRRCGASLATGYFIQFTPGELGPFGSSCIRKVLGRD